MSPYFQLAPLRNLVVPTAEGMGTVTSLRVCGWMLWLFFIPSLTSFTSIVNGDKHSLVVGQSTTLQLSPSLLVERSPGSKPGTKVICERVEIHGLSRLNNLGKFASSVKVKVSCVISSGHLSNIEVCFHRNASLRIGMCPQGQWEKLTKGSWSRSMSPFDHKLLDIRMAGSFLETLEVSLDEEFFLYRIILLVMGIVLMTLASSLSKSLVFYYSGAMAVGAILVVLIVLFQGMRLLPTGRKNSLAIFVYSSIIGLGSFLLRYVPRLLRSILVEIGIGEDMYNPLAIFMLVFLVITGAWLGFWAVRKLVLMEDGSIDLGVSHFVAWSLRIFASVMILQSSLDPLLAAGALVCAIFVSSTLRRISRPRFIRRLFRTHKRNHRRSQNPYSSPTEDSYGKSSDLRPKNSGFLGPPSSLFAMGPCSRTGRGSTGTPSSQQSDSDAFYSSFHKTPERRKFSKEEWGKFTRESTKKALEGLVSSPDFSKWAVARAERITLTPNTDTTERRRRWLFWF